MARTDADIISTNHHQSSRPVLGRTQGHRPGKGGPASFRPVLRRAQGHRAGQGALALGRMPTEKMYLADAGLVAISSGKKAMMLMENFTTPGAPGLTRRRGLRMAQRLEHEGSSKTCHGHPPPSPPERWAAWVGWSFRVCAPARCVAVFVFR